MNLSTDAWVSGWVKRRQPPATFRNTRPDPRSSSVFVRRSHNRSVVCRSSSRAWAMTDDVSGSSETNSKASSAPVSCLWTSSVTEPSPLPLNLDLAEGRSLLKLDLPFTVELEDSQEAHHDMDPVLAVRDQLAERRLAAVEGGEALLDGRHRFRHGVPDRGHVRQVDRRRRSKQAGRKRRKVRRRHRRQRVRVQPGELRPRSDIAGGVSGFIFEPPSKVDRHLAEPSELEGPRVQQIRGAADDVLLVGFDPPRRESRQLEFQQDRAD